MTARPNPGHAGHSQKGLALMEALVASAVLGMGLAGATRLSLQALQTASDTRQQMVAHTLAMGRMECHQSARALCEAPQVVTVQGTPYTVRSQGRARPDLALLDIEVSVQWPAMGRVQAPEHNRSGTATAPGIGQLVLHSSLDQVPAWVGVSLP